MPCDYKESIKKFIMAESNQINEAIDHLGLDPSQAELSNDGKLSISVKTEEGRMILFTENKIKHEINQFLKNMR